MWQFTSEKIEVPEDISEINRFFVEKGWSDGLPVIPPTEGRVLSLLHGTDRKPDEIIAHIPPKWAEATVEKVAINAVMAGCFPEHMPIIFAAVEAIAEERVNLYGIQATTHPCGVLLIVNGPTRKNLGINCSYGAFGPGTLANAVIGRAIRLILMNIGGAVPGRVDKSTLGQPGKFTYLIGENEEENPWEPLSVERGFSPEQSTVTVVGAEGPHDVHDRSSMSATGILTTMAGTLACQGNNNMLWQLGEPVVVLCPEHARTIVRDGFTKNDVKEFLFQRAKLPKSAFSKEDQDQRYANLPEDALISIARKPEDIIVIVAGGLGKHSAVIPTFGITLSVTHRIEK